MNEGVDMRRAILAILALLAAPGCHFDLLSGDPPARDRFRSDAERLYGPAFTSVRYRRAETVTTVAGLATLAAGFALLGGAAHEHGAHPGSPASRNLFVASVGAELTALVLGAWALVSGSRAHDLEMAWYEAYREGLERERAGEVETLIQALDSPDKYVRKKAAETLGNLAPRPFQAVPELRRVSRTDPEPYLRIVAGYALRKILGEDGK